MTTSSSVQRVKDADARAAGGDYLPAINLYESTLDGTPRAADIHYRLALLYDDKMNDPLNALHHFKRYLTLAPDGSHAAEVKNFIKRDELAVLTNLSGDTVVSRKEATGLRNENLALRKELEDARAVSRSAVNENRQTARAEKKAQMKKNSSHSRTYVVKAGDTLASISRKFYNSSARWKKIRDANSDTISDPQNLKIGQTLTVP